MQFSLYKLSNFPLLEELEFVSCRTLSFKFSVFDGSSKRCFTQSSPGGCNSA